MDVDAVTAGDVTASDPISITGSQDSLYIRWSYTTHGIAYAQMSGDYLDDLSFDISYEDPNVLPDGEYDDTIQLDVCKDAACAQPIPGSPFTITSALVIHGSTAHTVPPLLAAPTTQLTHDVLDAAMSPSLHAIAMTSATPDDALYLYDVDTGTEQKLPLSKPATTLGLSPDGRSAAVGHDAMVTWVDLTTLGQATPTVTEFAVPTVAWNVVPDGQGAIHVFPASDQWVSLYSIDIASGNVQTPPMQIYEKTRAKLHPSGDRVYTVETTITPENMVRYAVGGGTLAHAGDMPYWGDYAICGDFWYSQSGDRIYTACGNTFAATADPATDMVYAGTLDQVNTSHSWFPAITSLSDSTADGEVVLFDTGRCGAQGGVDCDTLLRVNETTHDNAVAAYRLPLAWIDGTSAYRQHGTFLFHGADDTVYSLSRAVGADPAKAWFLDTPLKGTNAVASARAKAKGVAPVTRAATNAAPAAGGSRIVRAR
jgi:hypothetical protein